MSFRAVLPWATCGNWWNTENCLGVEQSLMNALKNDSLTVNGTDAFNGTATNSTYDITSNMSAIASELAKKVSSSEEFWE